MAYNGRRAPNVSEYIANLNTIPTPHELDLASQENFNLDDDLAMFTNTQFFDFDLGQDADLHFDVDGRPGHTVAPDGVEMKALDFVQGEHMAEFSFSSYDYFYIPELCSSHHGWGFYLVWILLFLH